jgi:hypothetical protein
MTCAVELGSGVGSFVAWYNASIAREEALHHHEYGFKPVQIRSDSNCSLYIRLGPSVHGDEKFTLETCHVEANTCWYRHILISRENRPNGISSRISCFGENTAEMFSSMPRKPQCWRRYEKGELGGRRLKDGIIGRPPLTRIEPRDASETGGLAELREQLRLPVPGYAGCRSSGCEGPGDQ